MNKKDVWLILGSSPYVKTIEDWSFAEKYKTIGVNVFNLCPVNYRVANDTPTMFNIFRLKLGGKRILHKKNLENMTENALELLNPHYTYEWGGNDWCFEDGKLCCRHSSAIAGINFAIRQGAKQIILVGVDFTWDGEKARGEWRIAELSALIAKAQKYVEVYRVNPAEELPLSWLPLIRLEEL